MAIDHLTRPDGSLKATDRDLLVAIDRSQAMIEFDLSGVVLYANQNFLRAMGYTQEEIIGVHHSIFVDAEYATSDGYQEFWQRLQNGEFIADKFQRIAKDGSEVWIQASYNPILDANGRPRKIVKFATNITRHELFSRDARSQLEAISRSQAVVELSMDGLITSANENFCRITGYASEELIGQPHTMLVDRSVAASAEYRGFWAALSRGEYQASKYPRVGKGGKQIWLQAVYNPVLDGEGRPTKVVKFATDITHHEIFARDAGGQLQAISKSLATIEFMLDGTILTANENFCQLMGYTLPEIRARHHSMFVHKDDANSEEYRALWAGLATGVHQTARFRRVGKNGAEMWLQGSYNPIFNDRGRLVKVVKYATDITAHVRQAREAGELRELNAALSEARSHAEAAIRVKSDFLATMSHEIRTPMNGVLGMLEVALREEMAPGQRDTLATARDSAASLLHILNEILDYSKIEAGQLTFEAIPFNPRQILDEVTSMMDSQTRRKDITLVADVSPETPDWVIGDPTRFRQVLVNLVGNAVKFTETGGVQIRIGHDGMLKVVVRDTGIGMDERTQANLFTRFTQADASTTRKFGGTGLGLAICRQIVTQSGGDIGVKSRPGQGSVFWLTMPAPITDEPVLSGKAPAPLTPGVKARILIAEDNPVNQKVVRMLLAPHGHNLTFVENGAEAVERVRCETFDMVFMDVSMPVLDGPSASRLIRAQPGPAASIPIIALTANAMVGDREAYLSAGMLDYVSKPIILDDLLAAIQRNIGRVVDPSEWAQPVDDTVAEIEAAIASIAAE
jgi:methyl-accepting chemotaxis protein